MRRHMQRSMDTVMEMPQEYEAVPLYLPGGYVRGKEIFQCRF